ncbi:hypothetical protein G7Y89_g6203 [Cudoniella acicularis]|uniref:Uncharacterized protein n=1 Tax=Cudoniella acicularis TaxID=354080 RepID=A0A8H4W4Z6_9HELO|nr:hypothetical protein G7Y89_g6203 [Cudoniella acicularis]
MKSARCGYATQRPSTINGRRGRAKSSPEQALSQLTVAPILTNLGEIIALGYRRRQVPPLSFSLSCKGLGCGATAIYGVLRMLWSPAPPASSLQPLVRYEYCSSIRCYRAATASFNPRAKSPMPEPVPRLSKKTPTTRVPTISRLQRPNAGRHRRSATDAVTPPARDLSKPVKRPSWSQMTPRVFCGRSKDVKQEVCFAVLAAGLPFQPAAIIATVVWLLFRRAGVAPIADNMLLNPWRVAKLIQVKSDVVMNIDGVARQHDDVSRVDDPKVERTKQVSHVDPFLLILGILASKPRSSRSRRTRDPWFLGAEDPE